MNKLRKFIERFDFSVLMSVVLMEAFVMGILFITDLLMSQSGTDLPGKIYWYVALITFLVMIILIVIAPLLFMKVTHYKTKFEKGLHGYFKITRYESNDTFHFDFWWFGTAHVYEFGY